MQKSLVFVFCASLMSTVAIVSCSKSNNSGPSVQTALNDKQYLGQILYFDPRLSDDGTISCNSCHNVMGSGTDNVPTSMGVRGLRGARNSPTVFNAGLLSVQFWDGRAKDLAEQAKGPLINPVEMGNQTHEDIVARLEKIDGYKPHFKKAFGDEKIDIDRIADAIAEYEKTLTTLNSPYDKYEAGDKTALTAEQLEGFELFKSNGCTACHSGKNFAGPDMPLGQGFYMKFPTIMDSDYVKKYKLDQDLGRYDVTKAEGDKHMFRVPTLRNIAQTSPYFHNGSVVELKEAIKVMAKLQLNKDLDDETAGKIEVFLNALTGTIPPQTMPELPQTSGKIVVGEPKL